MNRKDNYQYFFVSNLRYNQSFLRQQWQMIRLVKNEQRGIKQFNDTLEVSFICQLNRINWRNNNSTLFDYNQQSSHSK